MNRLTIAVLAASMALSASAQKPMTAPQGGKQISDHLIGIFFEDISYATDGGLNANLVQNGSFEYNNSIRDEWGPGTKWKTLRLGHSAGYIKAVTENPLHKNNPTYMHIYAEKTKEFKDFKGWRGVGMQNEGFNGMNIKAGAKYDFSAFFRTTPSTGYITGSGAKQMRITLLTPGKKNEEDDILADTTITINGGWQKYTTTLTASKDSKNAALRILMLDPGDADVDMVTLMPEDTYHGHGIRKDLAEALEALHPKFMRFPGGCVVHGGGDGFWDTYLWKNTVGPKEQRQSLKNTWGYNQSMEVGYYEYFQLCEDMKMEPLPILPCGVSCQGVNGGWSMWPEQAQEAWPMDDMDRWAQDALDLIEWANGDVNTKWGKVRAEAGHPAPFNLKYLGIGNEEKISPEFCERFKYIYNKVKKAYPDIIIVGTAGPGSHKGNQDYEAGWKLAEETGLDIIDEHYYDSQKKFLEPCQYDKYPRDRKTKVYLGEYSVQEKAHKQKNQWGDALIEALYLMKVERNGDVVDMTSYAPLFAYKNNTCWNPDLIYFDNERPYLSCSYYVQQMFGESAGDYYYGDCVNIDGADDKYLGQSVVLNTKTRQLFVKVGNFTDKAVNATLDLSRFKGIKKMMEKTSIQGDLNAENNYEQHPIESKKETVKAVKSGKIEIPAHSFVMYKYSL